jgi:hypothetical protein
VRGKYGVHPAPKLKADIRAGRYLHHDLDRVLAQRLQYCTGFPCLPVWLSGFPSACLFVRVPCIYSFLL